MTAIKHFKNFASNTKLHILLSFCALLICLSLLVWFMFTVFICVILLYIIYKDFIAFHVIICLASQFKPLQIYKEVICFTIIKFKDRYLTIKFDIRDALQLK